MSFALQWAHWRLFAGRCGSTPPPTASRPKGHCMRRGRFTLYKKDTAITALKGKDWIELCNAAVDISS